MRGLLDSLGQAKGRRKGGWDASTLSMELTETRDSYQLGKIERQLDRTDLLMLDELSYPSFNKYEFDQVFKVLSDRSERSSTIVTINPPFP